MTDNSKTANQESIDQMKVDLALGDVQVKTSRQAIRAADADVTDLSDLGDLKTNEEVVADHKAGHDE